MKDFFFGFVLFLTYLKFQKRKKKVGQRGGRLFVFFGEEKQLVLAELQRGEGEGGV